jgi:isoprenylcysteine carboxyl methyltransferase (ICMT) family protein YpbQ
MSYLAHAGLVDERKLNMLSKLLHQPTWFGLLLIVIVVVLLYFVTSRLKLALSTRLLIIVGTLIIISVLYLPHNSNVTGIVLSTGFIVTFLITFTLLAKVKNQ